LKVVGVDPAPTKGLDVFDGQHRRVALNGARSYVSSLGALQDVLICWDAPLTGPPGVTVSGGEASGSAFSQRPIESFFSRADSGFKAPPGISVRGYSGCPHWAQSRSLLGLPRVGPFDVGEASLPFGLLTTDTPPTAGRHVAEVHPAVALWLWCRTGRGSEASWEYKKSDSVLRELWGLLLAIPSISPVLSEGPIEAPHSDDVFDARVAYLLGRLWLNGSRSVVLLGGADQGTFLLPRVAGLEAAFTSFVAKSA
jgi:hypothetical protein